MGDNMPTYTNRADLLMDDPNNTKQVGEVVDENPNFAPGATGETSTLPGRQGPYDPEDITNQPAVSGPDPRLGMNPQGTWSADKMQTMFPEMFAQPETWLDPAEEAKKRMGMPYDASKRYNPKKNELSLDYEGPSLRMRNGSAPEPRIKRGDMEREVFAKYGNPFEMNPYDDVVKSDANLKQLFEYIFEGKATWSDIGRLTKDQRELWEEAKKQYHARTFSESKAKQQKALSAYKWMMGNYDLDTKQEQYEQARADRLEAAQLARDGKGPTTRELLDPTTGQMMLYQYNHGTGKWDNTGMRAGLVGLEDRMPPKVKAAWDFVKSMTPKITTEQAFMLTQMQQSNPELAKQMMDSMMPKFGPGDKENLTAAKKIYGSWLTKSFRDAMTTTDATGTAKAQEAVKSQRPPKKSAILFLRNAKATGDPKFDQYVSKYRRDYADDPQAESDLQTALVRVGGREPQPTTQADFEPSFETAPAPGVSATPAATPSVAEPSSEASPSPQGDWSVPSPLDVGKSTVKAAGDVMAKHASIQEEHEAALKARGGEELAQKSTPKLSSLKPSEAIKLVVEAKSSGDDEYFQELMKKFGALYKGTKHWNTLQKALA